MIAHSYCMKLALTTAAAFLAAGCAPLSPNLDEQFGFSVYSFRAEQTLNPDASANKQLTQLDGQAAHKAIEQYQKSFGAPDTQQNVYTIGLSR